MSSDLFRFIIRLTRDFNNVTGYKIWKISWNFYTPSISSCVIKNDNLIALNSTKVKGYIGTNLTKDELYQENYKTI